MTDSTSSTETVLFGAFDRHNLGDILFPHIVARMLPDRRLRFAGLAENDLRQYGGHRVEAICTLAGACRDRTIDLVHVGGELLTCDAWEASVMLSSAQRVKSVIHQRGTWLRTPLEWANEQLGVPTRAPYVVPRERFTHIRNLAFNAIGGVELDRCEHRMRDEVIGTLKRASDVTVRDAVTLKWLEAEDIPVRLLPDPVVMVAELFGNAIHTRAASGPVSPIRRQCPNGYIAVQFSTDFGDDRTLDEIAVQLDAAATSNGLGVVFFRAGIAPWHDDLEVFERTRSRMKTPRVHRFDSPNVWDICALIAGSSVYCGSSLHGRIVATAFALPRVNVRHPTRIRSHSKQTAFASTWEDADMPSEVGIAEIKQGIDAALHIEPARLERIAKTLVTTYRSGFQALSALLA